MYGYIIISRYYIECNVRNIEQKNQNRIVFFLHEKIKCYKIKNRSQHSYCPNNSINSHINDKIVFIVTFVLIENKFVFAFVYTSRNENFFNYCSIIEITL